MNFKIALAAAILLTGGAYLSDAQQQAATKTVATAQSFNAKISEYEKASASQQNTALEGLKQQMNEGIAAAKLKIVQASGNTAQQQASEGYQKKVSAYNEVVRLSGESSAASKAGIVTALKQYAATL